MKNSKKKNTENGESQEIVIYQTDDGAVQIDVLMENETVWLSTSQMTMLFEREESNIRRHIINIFKEGELSKENNVHFLHVNGIKKPVPYYSLDVIISVGYRVKSLRGTQFRIWATKRLNEYIRKGFTLDDNRLKNLGGGGYWKELIERIRDIRSSEKVFYRQVLDIYAASIDYNPKADISIEFFKRVQNKIHFAVHGQTAAEVIVNRADAEKEYMGLTTFEGDRPHLKDVVVAKNYLTENELRAMGQIVSGYLDFAERQAERQQTMTMKDWAMHLDKILTMSGEKLLQGAGNVTHQEAIEHATNEYKKYQQRTLSQVEKDFLENIKTLPK